MKRIITILAVLLLFSIGAQSEPFGFTASGGIWTDNSFKSAGGGFLMGGIFPIDEGRGLYGRTQYHKFNVGDNGPVQSVDASILLMYSLGRNFDIFFHVGADFYMSGEEGSDFLGGFGCDKTIWQPTREGYETNHKIKAFFDIAFVDNDFESKGQYLKCFIGLVFYPAQK